MHRAVTFLLLAASLSRCAASAPAAGQPCRGVDTGACDPATSQLLQCDGQQAFVVSDCKGPLGCQSADGAVTCDTSGNSVGDRCAPTSEGKVRCEPKEGRSILRCVDAGLEVTFECPLGSRCEVRDGSLSCF